MKFMTDGEFDAELIEAVAGDQTFCSAGLAEVTQNCVGYRVELKTLLSGGSTIHCYEGSAASVATWLNGFFVFPDLDPKGCGAGV